ncbi:phosphoglycerol transferase [Salinibacillus kushneri]|uniref:Phosphoglycerol transferase n=1 Tax=Salinibacillus kushneri TaxID=237682 RepID=A0A1I0JIQ5_9BACI|nr:LTA synthase family protein [Salinibacillus kushneri]SEU09459.1 phosphoglycerol transferase [Salinibacillus kushneri]
MKKIINIVASFLTFILLSIAALICATAKYISNNFANQGIDEMIFYLMSGIEGTSNDVFVTAIKQGTLPFLLIFSFLLIPFIKFKKREHIISLEIRNKKIDIHIFPLRKLRLIYAFLVMLVSLFLSYKLLGFDHYLEQLDQQSTFISKEYVSGRDVAINFPEKKRNLIILYLESMENSLIDKKSGGGWDYTVIPELEKLAKENINFSNTDLIGGAFPVTGTDWTVAALTSTTSGLPLKIPVNQNLYRNSDNFMPGAYTLGDILNKEGYNLEVMFGSDASFGGRRNYYESHGNYKIFDLNTAIKEGKMEKGDKVWWGFDDTHLFKWAKEEITSLARSDQPFSFSFLTANTHFTDGYLESGADDKFNTQYENVYAYSSEQVNEFIKWLRDQDFYEETTLVIMGDHLSMQGGGFFPTYTYEGYKRTIYNTFLNTAVEPDKEKNRFFSSLDMYPTILASIGVEIEGNRLGLGTNLFSERRTLIEEFGFKHVNKHLDRQSNYYNKNILKDDYLELIKQANGNK